MNLRKLPTSSLLVVAAVAWSHSCPLANARGAGSSEGVRSRSSASKKAQHLLSGEASSPLLRRPPSSLSVGALRGGGGRVVPDRKSPAKQLKKVNPVQPAQVASSLPTSGVAFRLKVTFYFALWYALNIYYNIINKKLLNVVPLPWTVGSLQLGVGALYAATLWGLRLRAAPSVRDHPLLVSAVRQVGLWHSLGQELSMVSLGAGPVSFTHIVKALEPLFSAAVSAIWLGKVMAWPVYFTLLPVVGGVGYACLQERHFSWLAFGTAMGSNLAFALRAVLSKLAMTTSAPNWTPTNVFGLVTIFAFAYSLPMALLGEGRDASRVYSAAVSPTVVERVVENLVRDEQGVPRTVKTTHLVKTPAVSTPFGLAQALVVSGLFHYLNNEVMYLALSNVHPVTLAVGNTMKRVFIMAASVLVFRNPISVQAGIGSAIGISGVLLYSLTKQHYEQLEARTKPVGPAGKSREREKGSNKRVRNS